jgi:hypothetical protein
MELLEFNMSESTNVAGIVLLSGGHVDNFRNYLLTNVVKADKTDEAAVEKVFQNQKLIDAFDAMHSIDSFLLLVEVHFHPNGVPTFTIPQVELQRLQDEHEAALQADARHKGNTHE